MELQFLQKNKDITSLSNFKTKAVAKYYFEVNELDDVHKLKEIYKFSEKNNLQTLIIGGGTNLLFAFDLFDGIIIHNNLKGWSYSEGTQELEAYSAEVISDIAQILEEDDNQSLWHRFIGLPGSIGGAVYGNAGCFGLETENNFVNALVYNIESEAIQTLSKTDMQFEYRSSILKTSSQYFLIKAVFDLSQKREKYHSDVDNLEFREHKQPKGNTCGSFFKNPSKEYSGGRLIEEVGLKGYHIGGAYFSSLHANFLMNDGGSYQDLLDLIHLAQEKVKKEFGIDLVPEVRIISNK